MNVIDLFAGAGGSSEGARQAGATVRWAANHWPLAVEVHRRNHPTTHHECQDLHECDWSVVSDTVGPIDVVLASPACQGHSKASTAGGTGARASAPKHDADRSTAWAVVSCLEVVRPPVAVVENVVELRDWVLYRSWLGALAALGYTAAEHVVDAASLGVPQHRDRLFVVLSRSSSPLRLSLPTVEPVAARTVLDDRDTGWRPIDELPPAARARIERASVRYGDEFLAHYVSDDHGHSLDAPMKAVTTKHQWCLVRRRGTGRGRRLERRMFSSREYARAMTFPDAYRLTGRVSDDCRLVGNAVPPMVMRAIVQEIRRAA